MKKKILTLYIICICIVSSLSFSETLDNLIYKDGFYYRLDGEEVINGVKHQKVVLIPQKLEDSQYKSIVLYINPDNKQISKAVVKASDGIDYIWELLNFNVNTDLAEDAFQFDASKYPEITIEDMTE